MNVVVCIKRVPETGARITLTADEQEIDTSYLGFTISPHEECAVEEALRIVERHGGTTTVLTLGPPAAAEQLRNAIAMGVESAVLLETDGATGTRRRRPPRSRTRSATAATTCSSSATSRPTRAATRSASASRTRSGCPCVTGVKGIEIADGVATVRREAGGGWEIFEVPLPAVVTVKEGINLPRYPSLPGPAAGEEDGDRARRAGAARGRSAQAAARRAAGAGLARSRCSARAPRRRRASSRC